MKLRIHENSIRLRLTRSEVARFAAEGAIHGLLEFGAGPNERIAYGLESSGEADSLRLDVSPARMVILMPAPEARDWTESGRISVTGATHNSSGALLAILVEKEFRRLHGASNNPDLYPNPLESELATT